MIGWCNAYRDAGWPADTPGYVLSYYVGHLYTTGRRDELIALLEDRAWYQRHETFDPSAVSYLSGVETAWRSAEELDEKRSRLGMPTDRLGAEIRACLNSSSVASLSTRISPRLLSAFVDSGFWSAPRAFEAARLAPTAEDRAELLVALAGTGLDDDLHKNVVRTAMAATVNITPEERSAWIWQALAPFVPAELLDEALGFADSLPVLDDARPRTLAQAALLARAVATGEVERALDTVRALEEDTDRAQILARVGEALPADRIDEALLLVGDLERRSDQADPLAVLAVTGVSLRADSEALLREAFDVALSVPSRRSSWALRRLAPVLPEAWVPEALATVRLRMEQGSRWSCLTALAARLAALGQWAAAFEITHELLDEVWRVRGMAAIAPHTPKPKRSVLEEEMVGAVQQVGKILLPGELVGVAPHLTEQALRRLLDWAGRLDTKTGAAAVRKLLPRLADLGHAQEAYDRAIAEQEVGRDTFGIPGVQAWADLVPHLPEPLRAQACREALRLATSIDDARDRLLARVGQASALGGEAVRDLLRSLSAIGGFDRGVALRRLVPHLPAPLLLEAVDMAITVDATECFGGMALTSPRADVLTKLGPRLQGAVRDRALAAACTALAEVDDADERNEATLRVAKAFSAPAVATADVREAVARRIREVGYGSWRGDAVQNAGQFLPADLVQEVEAKRRTTDARSAKRVNDLLAPDPRRGDRGTGTAALRAAFHEAGHIHDQELRAAAQIRLAPHLVALLEREDSHETKDNWDRSRRDVLTALGPYLSHHQLPVALDAALDLITRDPRWSRELLKPLVKPLRTLPRDRLYSLWRRALHAIASLHRSQTLRHLDSLGPVVVALGEQSAAKQLVDAVGETGDWWP